MTRRRVFIASLLLCIGAVTNVVVAWTLALIVEYRPPWHSQSACVLFEDDSYGLAIHVPARAGAGGFYILRWTRLRISEDDHRESSGPAALRSLIEEFAQPESYAWIEMHGWPMASMWCDRQGVFITQRSPNVLPLRVRWRPFVVNTMCYSVLIGLLFLTPPEIRRIKRIRRGRCLKCGYPAGVSQACSECGAPTHPRRRTHEEGAGGDDSAAGV